MEELGKVIEERKQKKLSEAEKAKEREEQLKKEQELSRKEALRRRAAKRRKALPAMVMLTAGAAASVTMLLLQFPLKKMLPILLGVLVFFFIIGELMKWMFDRFAKQNEEAAASEGEVIEKEQQDVGN